MLISEPDGFRDTLDLAGWLRWLPKRFAEVPTFFPSLGIVISDGFSIFVSS
ncbi:MAG TPA: hypothetical protein ACQGQH_05495 [Xylella sp.]